MRVLQSTLQLLLVLPWIAFVQSRQLEECVDNMFFYCSFVRISPFLFCGGAANDRCPATCGTCPVVVTVETPLPSRLPSAEPSNSPSFEPSRSVQPSDVPSPSPSSLRPSSRPSSEPSTSTPPSASPSSMPSMSIEPSAAPSSMPSMSIEPSAVPSSMPSMSSQSSAVPSSMPSTSSQPSAVPSSMPSTSTEPSIAVVESVLPNWNFEEPTIDPWIKKGSAVSITKSDQYTAHPGSSFGALVEGRTSVGQGIQQDVTTDISPGVIYDVSLWARLVTSDTETTSAFKLKMTETTETNSGSSLIINEQNLSSEWQQLSGVYMLDSEAEVTQLLLVASGPPVGVAFAIDDVVFKDSKPVLEDFIVDADANTESVVIPQPPSVDLNTPRSNCPHLRTDLVGWNTLFSAVSEGDPVQIPPDTSVLVSQSIPTKLGVVTIPINSELIFGENATGVTMDAEGFEVTGSLIAGSEDCRLQQPLTITLHGERPPDITDIANAEEISYKGISVTGRLELHGKRYYRTWTRLARRAGPGENYLYLQNEVNWQPGQEIVLVTTAMRDSRDWHENEVFTIDRVETSSLPHPDVASVVYLTSPIAFDHIARPEYQGEVGLLTRMITVQGSLIDSPPADINTDTCQLYNHVGNAVNKYGYNSVVCPNAYLTGYGGHIMVHSGGVGYVEGVELVRMGQTNVLGRYPMHFHDLGDGCPGCYLKDSSIHQSFYRCISIHGTNGVIVSENVAFDVTGYCYYLEDGVEEDNIISYNLAAHIHFIGPPAIGTGQNVNVVTESLDLTLPADITASGFYITNVHNIIIGNVAVGGWSGFAFPVLNSPIGLHKNLDFEPSRRTTLQIDGNTAHSTGHWWSHAAAFYFGGSLYYDANGKLEYNAGRDQVKGSRKPCIDTGSGCVDAWNRITNSKVFLSANVGIGSWSGRMEVLDYECHDVGLSVEALVPGFWIDNMVAACRTGEVLKLPVQSAERIQGNGFKWYDTGQEHIITDSTFRNCGYRSVEYNQYDTSDTRGCGDNAYNGCDDGSSVFGFLTHSDEFAPEIMQATKNLSLQDVGRRFKFTRQSPTTVSGRTQNWFDVDGSMTGLNEPTLVGSGFDAAGHWWRVDNDIIEDSQGPLTFIQKNNGPARGLAHIKLLWDDALHSTVGTTACVNGGSFTNGVFNGPFCNAVGHIRHLGNKFNAINDPVEGLPVTANADIVGLAGGYGWLFTLDQGAPKRLEITQIEVLPDTPLILSIPYPIGTTFSVVARAQSCSSLCCEESFSKVSSVEQVTRSQGNKYHFDESTGVLTLRVIMFPRRYTGIPEWKIHDFNDVDAEGNYALGRFERGGVLLPIKNQGTITIETDCTVDVSNTAYCSNAPPTTNDYDNVCSSPDYEQVSFDRCCRTDNLDDCQFPEQAQTVVPVDTSNLIVNGDFESSNLCPWTVFGSKTAIRVKSDTAEGGSAALITNRANSYDTLGSDLSNQFEPDVEYEFQASIKILIPETDLSDVKATLKVTYEKGDGTKINRSYIIHEAFDVPGNIWYNLQGAEDDVITYVLNSSDMEEHDVIGYVLYIETPGSTPDIMLDKLSMEPAAGPETNIFAN